MLNTPIKKAELDAVLDKLPKAVVDEVRNHREEVLDDKEGYKQGRISTERYKQWRDANYIECEGFCLALELYGAITFAEARVLRRFMKGNKIGEEVQG